MSRLKWFKMQSQFIEISKRVVRERRAPATWYDLPTASSPARQRGHNHVGDCRCHDRSGSRDAFQQHAASTAATGVAPSYDRGE